MKLIRCQLCGAERIGPFTARFPQGAPVMWGHFSGGGGWIGVKCHRCTGTFRMKASQFNGLPDLTAAQREEFLATKSQPAVQ
jgi:hypothetical protein